MDCGVGLPNAEARIKDQLRVLMLQYAGRLLAEQNQNESNDSRGYKADGFGHRPQCNMVLTPLWNYLHASCFMAKAGIRRSCGS